MVLITPKREHKPSVDLKYTRHLLSDSQILAGLGKTINEFCCAL